MQTPASSHVSTAGHDEGTESLAELNVMPRHSRHLVYCCVHAVECHCRWEFERQSCQHKYNVKQLHAWQRASVHPVTRWPSPGHDLFRHIERQHTRKTLQQILLQSSPAKRRRPCAACPANLFLLHTQTNTPRGFGRARKSGRRVTIPRAWVHMSGFNRV